jgi:hypothetical protein
MYATGSAFASGAHNCGDKCAATYLLAKLALSVAERDGTVTDACARVQWRRTNAPAGGCQRGRRSAKWMRGDLIANPIIAPSTTLV